MSEHHPDYLGHHYETPEQQFASGKLGMWLFLATEILLFGGLFCAYAIYRASHPEIFVFGHQFLDVKLGAINTSILICSSFTMALAVRMAQLGRRRTTALLLALTLLGGAGFLSIKKVEYEQKWKHGLLWGNRYQPRHEQEPGSEEPAHGPSEGSAPKATGDSGLQESDRPDPAGLGAGTARAAEPAGASAASNPGAAGPAGAEPGSAAAGTVATTPESGPDSAAPGAAGAASAAVEGSNLPPPAEQPQELAAPEPAGEGPGHEEGAETPKNVQIFFGIYFLMTGLHGLHVIAGMGAITWVLVRTLRGHFSAEYSTPVDLTGLYWHLVDLIWIYLFPLLYLIH